MTHSLTVVFFARTLYLGDVNPTTAPELCAKASLHRRSDGVLYQDFFKVVLENVTEVDKVNHLKRLKREFWAFPKNVGWNVDLTGTRASSSSGGGGDGEQKKRAGSVHSEGSGGSSYSGKGSGLGLGLGSGLGTGLGRGIGSGIGLELGPGMGSEGGGSSPNRGSPVIAVPSDAVSGNVIEAINTTLNLLDKHYIDRDLNRTGNLATLVTY